MSNYNSTIDNYTETFLKGDLAKIVEIDQAVIALQNQILADPCVVNISNVLLQEIAKEYLEDKTDLRNIINGNVSDLTIPLLMKYGIARYKDEIRSKLKLIND